jgi:hypothetical protein
MRTTLQQITVADYLKFMELAKKCEGSTDPLMPYHFLSEYSGQDLSDVDEDTISYALEEIVQEMTDTTILEEKMDKIKLPKSIKVAGATFKIPHNLQHSATMAQYVDYAAYVDRYDGPTHGLCAIVCAIFLRNGKEFYSQINLNDRIETMKTMRLVDAVKIAAFFLSASKMFREITLPWFIQSPVKEQETAPLTLEQ